MWRRLVLCGICCVALAAFVVPVDGASASSCTNDALRSELHSGQLPDCRAYELVTPAYKEGAYLSAVFAITQDGSHLLGSSLGVFAGTEGDGLGNGTGLIGATYEFSRTGEPANWVASPLNPPSSTFASNGAFDASADLSATLWELGRHRITSAGAQPTAEHCPAKEGEEELQPEGVTNFYLEDPHGTFTRVGPATPDPCTVNGNRYTYLGGSADLSRILFTTSPGFRWPFDETAEDSSTLYQYANTEKRCSSVVGEACPSLVGVGNDGKLLSDCGTRLGSSTTNESNGSLGSMYNAISASGNRIFFTAVGEDDQACGAHQPPVDELFAREGPQTTSISCHETMSSCADANFEGASLDGSKVFFTSTLALVPGASEDRLAGDSAVGVGLPPNEARGCVRTEGVGGCNLYMDELSGSGSTLTQRLVLVSVGSSNPRVQGVSRISEDGSHVFFVAKGVLTGVANNVGATAIEGLDNLYVFSAGQISFVATLSPEDEKSDWARADERNVQVSWNGDLLVFTSLADLTDESVTPGMEQVYQYDAQAKSLVRASIGENGYGNDNRTPASNAIIVTGPPASYSYTHDDSPTQAAGVLAPANGAVFFTTPDALTPQALSDRTDTLDQLVPNIYEYRAGNVYLISDGSDESTLQSRPGVTLFGSDLTGSNVFFATSDSLVGQDTDSQQDVYDARVEGGIPLAPSSPACSGEGCRGALSSTPSLLAPASTTRPAESSLPLVRSSTTIKPKRVKKKTRPKRKKRTKRAGRQGHVREHRKAGR